MLSGEYFTIALSGFLILALAWFFRARIAALGKPTYQELLEKKRFLDESVVHWKYPNGTHVPQHKRQQMFKDLHKLSYKIRHHPDHPNNQSGDNQSCEERSRDFRG